jgi:hypothetical protein
MEEGMNKEKFASDLITYFFLELNYKNINFVVLRNYKELPESNSSKDVDILIDENCIVLANDILLKVSQELEYNFIWENRLDYLTGYAFINKVEDIVYSIKIDLFHGLKWRGLTYIDSSIIFDKKEKYSSLYAPNKSHESFIMIIYYILYAKNIKNKYFENIYLYKNDIENFIEISRGTLGGLLSKKIVINLESENIGQLVGHRKEIIKAVFDKNVIKFSLMIRNYRDHVYCELIKRCSFGVIILFNENCHEKGLVKNIFIDLGIGYENQKTDNFSIFGLMKILRHNPLMVLDKDSLSSLQKKIFSKRVVNIKNSKLEDIFLNIEQQVKKGK